MPEIGGFVLGRTIQIVPTKYGFGVSAFKCGTLHRTFGTHKVAKKCVAKDIVPKREFGADVLHQSVGIGRKAGVSKWAGVKGPP